MVNTVQFTEVYQWRRRIYIADIANEILSLARSSEISDDEYSSAKTVAEDEFSINVDAIQSDYGPDKHKVLEEISARIKKLT